MSFPEARIAALVAVAFVLGGLLVFGGGLVVFLAMRPQVAAAQGAATAATERLLSAWREGVPIPPADTPDEGKVIDALPEVVDEWLSQWDDTGRAHYGRKAHQLAKAGHDGPTIVVSLDRLRATTGAA